MAAISSAAGAVLSAGADAPEKKAGFSLRGAEKTIARHYKKLTAGLFALTLSAFGAEFIFSASRLSALAGDLDDVPATPTTGKSADDTWTSLIKFFATWFSRIGLLVAFVGAIMFGLAVKNEDADQKSKGIMTLAAGFIVFAVSSSLSLFGLD